jgi:hypothetical protein
MKERKKKEEKYEEDFKMLKNRLIKNDYSSLIRALFAAARSELGNLVQSVRLASDYMQPIYDINVDVETLLENNTFLSYILKKTANKYGLSAIDLIHYLRIKRKANAEFHLENEIKEFAQQHLLDDKYELSTFIKGEELLINTDSTELRKLEIVFEKLCRIFNDQRY